MSIINKPPEMVKREYELQEPIAVAVEFRRWLGPPENGRTFSRGWRGASIRKQMPSETPRWLVIPERDLFTAIAIVGAVPLKIETGVMPDRH